MNLQTIVFVILSNFVFLFFCNFSFYDEKNEETRKYQIIQMESTDSNLYEVISGVTVDTDGDYYADEIYTWGGSKSLTPDVDRSVYNVTLGHETVVWDNYVSQGHMLGTPSISEKVNYPSGMESWGGKIIDLKFSSTTSGALVENTDGTNSLYLWGNNNLGQISYAIDGTIGEKYYDVPQKVIGNWSGNIVDFDLSATNSGVLIDVDNDGKGDEIWMWGDNYYGQLGCNSLRDYTIPKKSILTLESDESISDLIIGKYYAGVVVDAQGKNSKVYTWGNNYYGQLGVGELYLSSYIPRQIFFDQEFEGKILKIESNHGYKGSSGIVVDVDYDGYGDEVLVWGNNEYGMLGMNDGTTSYIYDPTKVSYPNGQSSWNGEIIDIDLHDSNMLITTKENDEIYTYYTGININKNGEYLIVPTKLNQEYGKDEKLISTSIGSSNDSLFFESITDTNNDGLGDKLYTWGNNECGQLETNNFIPEDEPKSITSIFDYELTKDQINLVTTKETESSAILNYEISIEDNITELVRNLEISRIIITDSEGKEIKVLENPFYKGKIEFSNLIEDETYSGYKFIVEIDDFSESRLEVEIPPFTLRDENFLFWIMIIVAIIFVILILIILITFVIYKKHKKNKKEIVIKEWN